VTLTRGDIHGIDLPVRDPKGAEIEKRRPCVILSLSGVNALCKTVVVVPRTKKQKDAPPILISVSSGGLDSKAVCDQILAVDKRRVLGKAGSLSQNDMKLFEESVSRVLGL
jgi:mRNA-degrading endonuclease toxin of MazEF toxin-antitoxin module